MERRFLEIARHLGGVAALGAMLVLGAGSAGAESPDPTQTESPLELQDAIEIAMASFPILRAFALEEEARSESARAAAGSFDTRLTVEGRSQIAGFYENWEGGGSIEQLSPIWGARFYSGYRYGGGDFGSYDGKRMTDEGGELSLGIELPLLRGRAVDEARASLMSARLAQSSFSPELASERIALVRAVTLAYLEWVTAGHVVDVVEGLLEAAEERQAQLTRRVEAGDEPRINLRDNQRLVVERRSLLRGAVRDARQAGLRLSMYLTDQNGDAPALGDDRLPERFPDEALIPEAEVEADLQRAFRDHPRLRQLAIEREQLDLTADLAKNATLPGLNLGIEGSQDFGKSKPGIDERGKLSRDPRSSTEVGARLKLEFPVQQRRARGQLGVARVRLRQLEQRIRLAKIEIEVEARVALEALNAAFEQTQYARENVELADELRLAEARKVRSGISNLIDLNIREVQYATAAKNLIFAQRNYFRALAEYRARVARES